jgi:hypothetical protein
MVDPEPPRHWWQRLPAPFQKPVRAGGDGSPGLEVGLYVDGRWVDARPIDIDASGLEVAGSVHLADHAGCNLAIRSMEVPCGTIWAHCLVTEARREAKGQSRLRLRFMELRSDVGPEGIDLFLREVAGHPAPSADAYFGEGSLAIYSFWEARRSRARPWLGKPPEPKPREPAPLPKPAEPPVTKTSGAQTPVPGSAEARGPNTPSPSPRPFATKGPVGPAPAASRGPVEPPPLPGAEPPPATKAPPASPATRRAERRRLPRPSSLRLDYAIGTFRGTEIIPGILGVAAQDGSFVGVECEGLVPAPGERVILAVGAPVGDKVRVLRVAVDVVRTSLEGGVPRFAGRTCPDAGDTDHGAWLDHLMGFED